MHTVEKVAFIWDEFCAKAGNPNEKVQDPKACTFGGKPATYVPTGADMELDGEEVPQTTPPNLSKAVAPAAPPAPKSSTVPAKSKGRGRNTKGA